MERGGGAGVRSLRFGIMPLPRVVIVGRPNVGKSSLLNMIAGAKVAIVDPSAGTTRDRVSAIVELEPPVKGGSVKAAEFIDTGGFGAYTEQGKRFDEVGHDLTRLTPEIEAQIAAAVESADVVLFCIDVQAGLTGLDMEIARRLREGRLGRSRARRGSRGPGPVVRVVATKVDGPKWETHAHELAQVGFGDPVPVSARSNYFRRDFLNAVWALLPEGEERVPARSSEDLHLAIVGKRNAGKSTLVNTLAGEPRMIVSEIPGTTRDAVDVRCELDGRAVVAIDTAGLRRKKSFQGAIDWYALDRLQRAVDRCDVALLLIDATAPISQVDEHVAQMIQKSFKPAIIVVNKWDAVEGKTGPHGRPVTPKAYEKYVRKELAGLVYAPISFMSGLTGLNVRRTIDLAWELREQARARVTTGKLNRLVREILEKQGPPDVRGRFAKVFYVAQTGVEPPTITLVVNHPELFTPGYLRFLLNRFRESLPFEEVPIRIVVRARRQREGDLALAAEHSSDEPIRVRSGRKAGTVRRRSMKEEIAGEALLNDDHSEVVDVDQFAEDEAEEYFRD
jgi:GTP-binding protein